MRITRPAHNVCLSTLLAISISVLLPLAISIQQSQHFPADYLLPPPLPTPQHLKHQNAPAHQTVEAVAAPSHSSGNVAEPPGFMTRVARWFGFGAADQNQLANGFSSDSKQTYNYPPPLGPDGKPCNLCNRYPWVPMFPQELQYQAATNGNNRFAQLVPHQQPSHQHFEAQASQKYAHQQASPLDKNSLQLALVRQRAVKFNFPAVYQTQPGAYKPLAANAPAAAPFLPIPVPNLSLTAMPPIYNAQQFRQSYLTPAVSTTTTTITEPVLRSVQQLPSTEPAHFAENIGAHSEIQPDRVRPVEENAPPKLDPDPSFEIVKSHQITDFVSSVEYPVSYEQSPSIDLGQPSIPVNQQTANESVATVQYQHQTLSPNLHKHLPASQLLTELGSFAGTQKTQQTQRPQQPQQTQILYYQETPSHGQTQSSPQYQQQSQVYEQHEASRQQQNQEFPTIPQTYEPSTIISTTPYAPQTQYPQHNYEPQGEDNFPSASTHNLTKVQNQQENQQYNPWIPVAQTFPYTTTEMPREYDLSTHLTQLGEVDYITERFQEITQVQFSPSLQTQVSNQQQEVKQGGRDTPKRFLDSPIQHAQGLQNHPRPFTRDPSELNLRSPSVSFVTPERYPNHKHNPVDMLPHSTPWLVTPQPPILTNTAVAAAPTPTSTYSAIDASGQYAGMSPPTPPPSAHHKDLHQIIIPYTTKNKPRPFEPTRTVATGNPNTQLSGAFHKWSTQQNSIDIHEQQESKVVSAHLSTEAPNSTPPRRTTKYVTKILASNLRDLLRREHEVKQNKTNSFSFDLSKLQKNIDDWTEQEYTSLSHRPSTPTIRGRSKHIPTEYLTTTTPSPRRPKTTISFFEESSVLPASINELQTLLLERGSKRFELNQIDDEVDNHLLDALESETATMKSVTPSRTTTQLPPNSNGHAAPNFMHFSSETYKPEPEPAELWRKAKVSISPQTHEKVYVVTPQPLFFPQRALTTAAPSDIRKTARFIVRPTPGNGTNSSTPVPSLYNPELFGLMGLSAYVPAKPVEIIDGNSKVLNIITTTPTSEQKNATTGPKAFVEQLSMVKKGTRLRSTMSPSPR